MAEPIRVARIIARINVGGPAIHVCSLTARLPPPFETKLFVGSVGPGEREMTEAIEREGINPIRISGLGRAVSPTNDAGAFVRLVQALRRFRPHIVHTHTAKAGTLGRLAAQVVPAPAVHTFHGHVFDGYFSPVRTRAVLAAERALALLTRAIIVISPRQREDIVERYRVARADKVHLIPLGFDLTPFDDLDRHRGELHRKLGLPGGTPLVASIGRLTAIKDHPLLFQAFAAVKAPAHLLVIGGGEEEVALRAAAGAMRCANRIHFLGFRSDLPRLLADVSAVVLTSRNEGTPVALIEAMAAGCTPIGVDVGGVADVLSGGIGKLVRERDPTAIAQAIDAALNERAGLSADVLTNWRQSARRRYGVERLVHDHIALYRGVLNGA